MPFLAGIDLGSTSLKAVLYDLDGRAVAHASRPTELSHPYRDHPAWAIWRPEQILGGVAAHALHDTNVRQKVLD